MYKKYNTTATHTKEVNSSLNSRKNKFHQNKYIENIHTILTTTKPQLNSSTGMEILMFDDNQVDPTILNSQVWTSNLHTDEEKKTYLIIQEVDDVINRAKDMWMITVPNELQKLFNVTLNPDRNGYVIDYATKAIVILWYLPLSERNHSRGIGTAIVKRAIQDANEKLAFAGGVQEIIDMWYHGDDHFDHNTNLDMLNSSIKKWITDVDILLLETPAGKMINREWFTPYRFAMNWWKKWSDHAIIWYNKHT